MSYFRTCTDCGARSGEAAFPGTRKPYGRPDRCTDCAADPFAVQQQRLERYRTAVGAARSLGICVVSKPSWSLPLFAALKPPRPRRRAVAAEGAS